MNIFSFIAAILALAGQVGIIYRKPWAFVLWFLSNSIWIYVAIFINTDYSLLAMNFIFLVLNVFAYIKWKV